MSREVQFRDGHIRFVLTGDEGAVQFLIYTGWNAEWVQDDGFMVTAHANWPSLEVANLYPMPADLGYHWPTPRYEDQHKMDCDLLEQGYCFYDGSGLRAYPVFAALLKDGHEAVWAILEDEYRSLCATVD